MRAPVDVRVKSRGSVFPRAAAENTSRERKLDTLESKHSSLPHNKTEDINAGRRQSKQLIAKSAQKTPFLKAAKLNPVQKPPREHSMDSSKERDSDHSPFSKNPSSTNTAAQALIFRGPSGYLSGPIATDTESARLSNA